MMFTAMMTMMTMITMTPMTPMTPLMTLTTVLPSQDGSVACLVLGTESSSVYILDPEVDWPKVWTGLLVHIFYILHPR